MIRRDIQRLFDLVRYCRKELHEAGLISDEEYVTLCSSQGSVERLEKYDRMIEERQQNRDTIGDLKKAYKRFRNLKLRKALKYYGLYGCVSCAEQYKHIQVKCHQEWHGKCSPETKEKWRLK